MTTCDFDPAEPRRATPNDTPRSRDIGVWDPFVRVFHWSLVIGVVAAFLTGDDLTRIHIRIGWVIAALVAARIVWGFVGPRHARFRDFVRGPRAVFRYLYATAFLRARRYVGHNPAGGAMVVALLVLLGGLTTTGWMLTLDAFFGDEMLEEIHVAIAWTLVVFVGLHVAGVIVASLEHGENLVRAMFTGRKRL